MDDSLVIGRNAVIEALRADVNIDKIFISNKDADKTLGHIASKARSLGITVTDADKNKLDSLCKGLINPIHQGVVAVSSLISYSSIDEILGEAREKSQKPLIIICDEITDPHNLGAIIRTSHAAGAHGVIISKRRSASVGATVSKASSGAVFHTKIAKVPNITAAVKELKKHGVWIYGADANSTQTLWETDFTDAAAFVIGSEGKGISRLVRDNCDFCVSIPMNGKISSLNASVSASVLLYEAYRQRR